VISVLPNIKYNSYKCDLNKGASQFSGTPSYLAPEVFQKKPFDEKVDVFAFGALLWEIFSKDIPYDGLEPGQIL
jgi:serine/threonine protein kinase